MLHLKTSPFVISGFKIVIYDVFPPTNESVIHLAPECQAFEFSVSLRRIPLLILRVNWGLIIHFN